MAFAIAAILRFLTPISGDGNDQNNHIQNAKQRGIYVGWLDDNNYGEENNSNKLPSRGSIGSSYVPDDSGAGSVSYADGLRYDLSNGWYEFRCDCRIRWRTSSGLSGSAKGVDGNWTLPEALAKLGRSRQPCAYEQVVQSYIFHPQGGDLQGLLEGADEAHLMCRARLLDTFVSAVSTLYARMVGGDTVMHLLREMMERQHVYYDGMETSCDVLVDNMPASEQNALQPLHYRPSPIPDTSHLMNTHDGLRNDEIRSVVFSEVRGQQVIDLHTHLLPPSHGALCLWGIDELLTYHYLVAEYFMTAPADISPEGFYAMSKKQQVRQSTIHVEETDVALAGFMPKTFHIIFAFNNNAFLFVRRI